MNDSTNNLYYFENNMCLLILNIGYNYSSMKIFVIHYSKLIERKKHIINQFEKQNITDYEFIEKYDKEHLEETHKTLFVPHYKESMMSFMNKTFYIYKEIAEKYDTALIIEDDVIFSNNFSEILNAYMSQLPENYDMLFIGDGCNLHIQPHELVPYQNIYKKELYPTEWGGDGATRCTDSYIVSKKCAIKLCEYIQNLNYKIHLPGDWWLNVAARDNKFRVYWAEPTIVTQGTQNGLFTSSH
jgi:GR25 family glycosyltransferase involved in LPS biosynthesis